MNDRVAFILDGGFVRVKLSALLGRFPEPADVMALASRIQSHERLRDSRLLRVYFYDAPPMSGTKAHPLSGKPYRFDAHRIRELNQSLQDGLAHSADVAVRRGEIVFQGWRLRDRSLKEIRQSPRLLTPEDLAPHIEQKGVDLRIGLDVAWLAIKRIVHTIVLVTGDSDFVPAMKFARREGLRVYLDTMGHGVRPGLVEHADFVLDSSRMWTREQKGGG